MPRINLLPWREELRTQRRNQFFIALGGAAVVALVCIGLSAWIFNAIIDHQNDRNGLLNAEIAELNKLIDEIIDLEDKKDGLLARMEIIEQLQRSRPGIVHVFEEMVRTLPDGVHLREIKQTGRKLEIVGLAESNTRVSALMRNIDKSDWLADPDLEVVEVRPASSTDGGLRESEFTVFAQQAGDDTGEDGE